MRAVQFLPDAAAELIAQVQWYEEVNSGLGARFLASVQAVTTALSQFPESGKPFVHAIRQFRVKEFPFSVIYRADSERLLIVAVAHHAQRPNYWRNRK